MTFNHPEFKEDLIQLTRKELNPFQIYAPLTTKQIKRLVETASLFSLDDDKKYQKLAFKIAVYLLNQYQDQYQSLPLAVEIIMSRLGNIPTIYSMIENKHGRDFFSFYKKEHNEQNYDTISTYIKFPEILVKQITNKKKINEETSLTFTNFQAEIYSLLTAQKSVTFSAPTSTGKSYIIHNYIAERILELEKFSAVYIVPTKALIAEVKESIEKKILSFGKKLNEFGVFISANYLNIEEINKVHRKVFVLTQERLQDSMANNPLKDVDLLVVDEAQKVSDEGRGVIIEDAVQELLVNNPKVQTIIVSPYADNPQKFKTIFGISKDIEPKKTSDSPVTQNIFLINFAKKSVTVTLNSWDLDMPEQSKQLKEFKVQFVKQLPTAKTKRKAWVVENLVPKGEPTIIYCDKPYYCRQVAASIAEGQTKQETSEKIKEAIKFFTEHVHEEYYLVDALKNRIGYHYGKMPQFVRFYIKNLFEEKEITLLCCTSTLLEGVNLPAKNMVLYAPKAGKPMNRLSILNLAGRAGRLLKDYYGKIYCINISEWENGEDVFSEKLEKIESTVEKTLSESIEKLIKYLENENYVPSEGKLSESVKTLATSLLMKQLKYPKTNFVEKLRKRSKNISQDQLDQIKQLLEEKTKLDLNKQIILKNRSIDPRFQNQLYNEIKDNFIPLPFPDDPKFYQDILKIFEKISTHINREQNKSYEYYAFLANRWIHDASYKSILEGNISYNVKKRKHVGKKWKTFVNKQIDDLDDAIEKKIKYEYTRALKAYLDISEYLIQEKGIEISYCKELPIFLEAGTCNKNTLFLLEIGLSRNVALKVAKIMDLIKIEDSLQCIEWLSNNKIKMKNRLPELFYAEVQSVLEKYRMN